MTNSPTLLSDVVLYTTNRDGSAGYPFQELTVTLEAGMTNGAVLAISGNKAVWATKALIDACKVVGVLADQEAVFPVAAGDRQMVVLARAGGVNKAKLTYKGGDVTDTEKAAAMNQLSLLGVKTEAFIHKA